MPTISSHVLNSEDGTHVPGLTITLTYLKDDRNKEIIFSNKTDKGGRLSESFSLDLSDNKVFELEFKISDLFPKKEKGIYCSDLTFRLSLNSPEEKFHIPVIISRHGASTWWSGE